VTVTAAATSSPFVAAIEPITASDDEIRAALAAFLAVSPRMDGHVEKVLEAGDTALVANRWRLHGTAEDGSPVEMAATSADVLRRRPDGSWGIVIDDPWGTSG
jgi:ketosteroid isomerase-like protein